jgi:vacuolar iron transporter family protein
LHADHTPEAIRRRLGAGPAPSYLRDFVYGAIDGTVTTFAVVAGVVGAGLRPAIIVILGMANLMADGFSMAASNFLATRSEIQQRERARRAEEQHVKSIPEGEREEIRQIYASKGFSGEDLERAVEIITSDRERWIETMLREEHGFSHSRGSPVRAGASTFVAFFVVGAIPLVAFVYDLARPGTIGAPFVWSMIGTGIAFFVVGAVKGRFVDEPWWRSGAETLALGAAASAIAFGIGTALGGLA